MNNSYIVGNCSSYLLQRGPLSYSTAWSASSTTQKFHTAPLNIVFIQCLRGCVEHPIHSSATLKISNKSSTGLCKQPREMGKVSHMAIKKVINTCKLLQIIKWNPFNNGFQCQVSYRLLFLSALPVSSKHSHTRFAKT